VILLLTGPVAWAETRAIVVAGLGGTAEFETAFQRHARDTSAALSEVAGDVTLLLGDMVIDTRLRDELLAVAARSSAEDTLLLVLIGHGTFDERTYRFNIPGPDVAAEQLRSWLDEVPAGRQLLVVATSASGALQALPARDDRAVMTATRSGGERNASVFARYFSEALTANAADTDKDGYVDAQEAFAFAEAGVVSYYDERREMATEHPTLDGEVAGLVLARLPGTDRFDVGGTDTAQLDALEAAVLALRGRKSQMTPDAYYAELQRLLLDLAVERRATGESP
jgi:hypothetical protein